MSFSLEVTPREARPPKVYPADSLLRGEAPVGAYVEVGGQRVWWVLDPPGGRNSVICVRDGYGDCKPHVPYPGGWAYFKFRPMKSACSVTWTPLEDA